MTREPPYNVVRELRSVDPGLTVAWDEAQCGWVFVYNGRPQHFILEHEDGSTIYELHPSEVVEIAHKCDMNNHFDALEKARAHGRRLRERKNDSARRFVDSNIRAQVQDVADFSVKRKRQIKPFVEINNNPIGKKKE